MKASVTHGAGQPLRTEDRTEDVDVADPVGHDVPVRIAAAGSRDIGEARP